MTPTLDTENKRFRHVRESILKYSRKDFSNILNKGQQTIYDIESGKINVQIADIKFLRENFKVNPNFILFGEEPIIENTDTLITPKADSSSFASEPQGVYLAGPRDVNALVKEICAALPEDKKELCEKLQEKILDLMEEKNAIQDKLNKIVGVIGDSFWIKEFKNKK